MDRKLSIDDWGQYYTHEQSDKNYGCSHFDPIQSMNSLVNVKDRCVFNILITKIMSHDAYQIDSWPLGTVTHPNIIFFFFVNLMEFPILSFNDETFCRVATPSTINIYLYLFPSWSSSFSWAFLFSSQSIFAASKYSYDTFYDHIPKSLFISPWPGFKFGHKKKREKAENY